MSEVPPCPLPPEGRPGRLEPLPPSSWPHRDPATKFELKFFALTWNRFGVLLVRVVIQLRWVGWGYSRSAYSDQVLGFQG